MLRRVLTLVVALALLVGLALGGLYLPMPYIVATPGVTVNTVGEFEDGPVIRIEGAESYEHDGALSMVTIQYAGGPQRRLSTLEVLTSWLSPSNAVMPEELLFPADRTPEEVSERQTVQMNDSQTDATAAALGQLGIAYEAVPVVADAVEGMPADGLVEPGDVIVEIDGEPVPTDTGGGGGERSVGSAAVVDTVSARDPGDVVEMVLDRDGETVEVEITTTEGEDGTAAVGILIADDTDFPIDVEISVGDIGGPSAGMMFALGIMDRLSEESLTGGARVAGSGTISADGRVGGISGIPQKMVSAQRDGAEYFLVAADSCDQVADSAAYGELEVARVETLDDAVAALETIRTGEGELPRCEGLE
ncbi:PDZ/DHR/GLGF domain-containing protein [Nocardiopsis sp. EMB25]|uniref:YlbL family protein n=1 Tax=Nocardiopsis sp. EMB25 TaxID=2835867 RepID=UPI0022846D3F|nr:S16 family serine protease [Nocardiopsis sp. EMB25]MCY9785614.1 PDZ/DHR/GLGF domain-containing protein [Nocardiopsis sp. EMB25]